MAGRMSNRASEPQRQCEDGRHTAGHDCKATSCPPQAITLSRQQPPLHRHVRQSPAADVVDEAVDRDSPRHRRMRPDPRHVSDNIRVQVRETVPLDVAAFPRPGSGAVVVPPLLIDAGCLEAAFQQAADDLVVKQLHAAIGVVEDNPKRWMAGEPSAPRSTIRQLAARTASRCGQDRIRSAARRLIPSPIRNGHASRAVFHPSRQCHIPYRYGASAARVNAPKSLCTSGLALPDRTQILPAIHPARPRTLQGPAAE